MARMSDIIEDFIKRLIDQASDGSIEIKRNELANHFNCAPSQINYVLETRFTSDLGYFIESRRGGGGFIKIIKVRIDDKQYADTINEKIGDNLTQGDAVLILNNLYNNGLISDREYLIMKAALSDRVLSFDQPVRNKLRASLLKVMLLSILN